MMQIHVKIFIYFKSLEIMVKQSVSRLCDISIFKEFERSTKVKFIQQLWSLNTILKLKEYNI